MSSKHVVALIGTNAYSLGVRSALQSQDGIHAHTFPLLLSPQGKAMGEGSLWNYRICSLLGRESKAWPSESRERGEGGEHAVHQPASKR